MLLVGSLGHISLACADEQIPALQIVCAPQANFFSVSMTNFAADPDPELKEGSVFSIRTLEGLKDEPYACRWGSDAIKIQLRYIHEPQDHGYCGAAIFGSADVSFNESHLITVSGGECAERRETVEITKFDHSLVIEDYSTNPISYEKGEFTRATHYFNMQTRELK
jgi:hypothetical protein